MHPRHLPELLRNPARGGLPVVAHRGEAPPSPPRHKPFLVFYGRLEVQSLWHRVGHPMYAISTHVYALIQYDASAHHVLRQLSNGQVKKYYFSTQRRVGKDQTSKQAKSLPALSIRQRSGSEGNFWINDLSIHEATPFPALATKMLTFFRPKRVDKRAPLA